MVLTSPRMDPRASVPDHRTGDILAMKPLVPGDDLTGGKQKPLSTTLSYICISASMSRPVPGIREEGATILMNHLSPLRFILRRQPDRLPAAFHRLRATSTPVFFSSSDYPHEPNPGLASIISQGMKSLDETAREVQAKTRKSLGDTRKSGPTPRQLSEAHRIMEVATDCLDQICIQGGQPGLTLKGDPIVILDVQVNPDIKQAKVFWTLPYGVLLDERVNQNVYQKLIEKLREEINDGGGKALAHQVRLKLRSYYPPKLKMVPATDAMVRSAIEEYLD